MKLLSIILICFIPLFIFSQTPATQPENKLNSVKKRSHVDSIFLNDEYSQPKFPGGESGFRKFKQENLHYPIDDWQNGKEGLVIVGFIIGEDGSVSKLEVLRHVSPAIDSEAVRVLRLSPKWKPEIKIILKDGRYQYHPAVAYYMVPFRFKIIAGRKIEDAFKEPYYDKSY